jgi:hypothetical protein
MKINSSILIAITFLFFFIVNCAGSGESKPTTPGNLLKFFANTIENNDKAKAETLCTKEFWKEKRDSGQRIFKQAVKKKFLVKEKEVKIKDKKAVVISDIIRKGKVVDQVYFYCINKDGLWFFDGMDENRGHIAFYLEGKLPGRFYPDDYPGDKELEALGAKLTEIAAPLKEATAPEQQETLLKGVFSGDTGRLYSELRLLREIGQFKLKVAATHMVPSIGRGAIVIKDKSGKEKAFIYVSKEAEGWKLVNCTTGWLSAESLLR